MEKVARNLRSKDSEEVFLSTGNNPTGIIRDSWNMSAKRDIVRLDKEPIGVLGVVSNGKIGIPWLVGTKSLDDIGKFFIKSSAGYVEKAMVGFSSLENLVYVEHKKSIRWLTWLGFNFDSPKPFGPFDALFMRFYLRSANV